jgi:hypothetical protein
LVDTKNGKHLWADRFAKQTSDLLVMQEEIEARVAGALHAQFIALKRGEPSSPRIRTQRISLFSRNGLSQ